jgi:repressor LexA
MANQSKTTGQKTAKTTRKLTSVKTGTQKTSKTAETEVTKDSVSHLRAEPPRPLSLKEKTVLEFLESYIREKGISPTYQEICKHFGFASFNSVQRYLKQLEAKGYVQLPWANQKRAITLLQSASALQSAMEDLQGDTPRSSMTPAIMPIENFTLPLLGRVAAGAPIEALDHDEFIDVPASLVRHADRTYALRVQGQSMIDDGILDGDVILVQRQTSASNGEIVVAVVNGDGGDEATVKRFYMHRGDTAAKAAARERELNTDKMIELRPANSSMAPMWYEPSEVQIRGVVVGLIRRFF